MPKQYTVTQAAKYLGVSRAAVLLAVQKKRLAATGALRPWKCS